MIEKLHVPTALNLIYDKGNFVRFNKVDVKQNSRVYIHNNKTPPASQVHLYRVKRKLSQNTLIYFSN